MRTLRLKVDAESPDAEIIEQAATILRGGGTVAFPTETVYGLGANALDANAVAKIFAAKERPSWDPLIVHVASFEMVSLVAGERPAILKSLAHFMPGPLTVLLPRRPEVPTAVTAGRDKVAVRIPRHPVALALIRAAGVPLAAPSANRFSRPSPTTADHVLEDLDGRIDAVLDAGPTALGVESTVLDVTLSPPMLLRHGGLSREQIEAAIGAVRIYAPVGEDGNREDPTPTTKPPESLPSPGLSIRHYAPRARMILTGGDEQALDLAIAQAVSDSNGGKLMGVLLPSGWKIAAAGNEVIFDWGEWNHWEKLASRLFAGLRWLDAQGVARIVAPLPPAIGIAAAIRDRLLKAARSA